MALSYPQKGFTLIELLVTVTILAIIALIATPYFQNLQAKKEASNTAIQLEGLLRKNRSDAVTYHQDLVMCGSEDGQNCSLTAWNFYLLTYLDQNHNRLLDSQEHVLSTTPLKLKYGSLNLKVAARRNFITFKGENGLPQGYMGSFYYCSEYDTHFDKRIVINMMGNPRTETVSCLIN